MKLAKVAILAGELQPETGCDDARRLDGTRQDAREEEVGAHLPSPGEVLTQGFGLEAAMWGQTRAASRSGDRPMEAGVRLTVAHEDQSHDPPR